MLRRVAPAFALFFLSPLVAEFLLGDFTLAGRVGHPRGLPRHWVLLVVTLAAGGLFVEAMRYGTVLGVIAMLVAFGAVLAALVAWARTPGHVLAAASGGVLTYAWHSFFLHALQGDGPVITPVSRVVFATVAVLLLTVLWRRRAWSDEDHERRSSGGVAGGAGGGRGGDALVRGPGEAASRAET